MKKKKTGGTLHRFSWASLWRRDKSMSRLHLPADAVPLPVVLLSYKLFFCIYRQYNVDYKLDTYLKIARLYLEDDDPVQAEAYINRASLLQNESTNEQLQIHYKVHHK